MSKELFVAAALRFLNLPYIWGGDDPIIGFDCSGLVQELLAMIGIDPLGDQSAQELHELFRDKSTGTMGCGTLVFYGKSKQQITHVAMMLDDQTIIEAGGGGSKTLTPRDAADQNAYIRLRPHNRRSDVVDFLRPTALPWSPLK